MIFKIIRGLLKFLFKILPSLGTRLAYVIFCWPIFGKIRNREQQIRSKADQSSSLINGKLIKQFRWGSAEKKVLLVHGWASNGGGLGGFVNPLTESGYQVVAFDGPAHGDSEGHLTNLIEFSNVLIEIIKKEKPEAIITHSFGSAASVLGLSEDDQLSIKKMIMITTPDELEEVIRDFSDQMDFTNHHHDLLVKYISGRFKKDVKDMQVHKLVHNIKVKQAKLFHDKNDDVLSFEGAKHVAENWDDLDFIPVEGKGHYRILWDKEVINKALEIL